MGAVLKEKKLLPESAIFFLEREPHMKWEKIEPGQDCFLRSRESNPQEKLLFNVWLEKVPSYLWNVKMCSSTLNKWRLTKYSKKPEQMHL